MCETGSSSATGSWADIAYLHGGPVLRIALVLGGTMSPFGVFNALVMSYSRLPCAMAQDGMLPGVFARGNQRQAPWVSIVVLATGWAFCLGLGFERLVTLDVLVYGGSLFLEFLALVMLPLVISVLHGEREQILGMSSLKFGIFLIVAGFAAYGVDLACA